MSLKKRGLGRGLEALLTDVWVKIDIEETSELDSGPARSTADPPTAKADSRSAHVDGSGLSVRLRKERQDLLKEAEALKTLIEELLLSDPES